MRAVIAVNISDPVALAQLNKEGAEHNEVGVHGVAWRACCVQGLGGQTGKSLCPVPLPFYILSIMQAWAFNSHSSCHHPKHADLRLLP